MEYNIRSKENSHIIIDYSLDMTEFEPYIEQAYQKNKGQYAIAGFRKGKVPRRILESHYGKELFYDDAFNLMLPDHYDRSIKELELEPVAQPTFDLEQLDDEGIKYYANVVVRPEVTLGQYKDFDIEAPSTEVTEEDIQQAIDLEREKNARMKTIDDRETKDGDVVTIDFVGRVDGEAFDGGSGEGFDLTLGSGSFIPGFEDQLIGRSIGDEVQVEVTFPENYPEELASKDAVFDVTIHAISEKELPELDDDFVMDISEFDTVDEYKQSVSEKLKQDKEDYAKTFVQNESFNRAIEAMEVDIPREMIDSELENMLHDFEHQLSHQGLDLAKYYEFTSQTEDQLKEQMEPEAINRLKGSLLFEAVIEAEGIEVTEEEIEAEIDRMVEETQYDREQLKQIYSQDDFYYLKQNLSLRKATQVVGGQV
ncbi:MAG TPA: trigger factor [Tissierellia bacterium]|nr:trigger factor [Tissierellia bacterium]